jgi:hypothetical protein
MTNTTLDIQINFTDYRVISDTAKYPDQLLIKFLQPQNLRRLNQTANYTSDLITIFYELPP